MRAQARLAGESLRDEGITTLYCGPMLRTLQTAQIVGAVLGPVAPRVCLTLSKRIWMGPYRRNFTEWGGVWEPRDDGNSVQLPGLTQREMSTMFPGCVLPPTSPTSSLYSGPTERLDGEIEPIRTRWFHDWEGDRAMLELAHRNALSFIAHLETHHVATEQRIASTRQYGVSESEGWMGLHGEPRALYCPCIWRSRSPCGVCQRIEAG